jgi:hypothetical protein
MSIKVTLEDGQGGGGRICVSRRGELATGPLEYSSVYNATAALDDTAYNLVPPVADWQFVVTDILLYADKGVGASDASVVLYEADGPDTTTVSSNIMVLEMLKQTSRDITGIRLLITAGKWINIKTNDNQIYATIMGYYIRE